MFEAYRFWSVKVKVIPNFNITDAAEATTPPYYSAPYHKGVPDIKLPESILTIDKSRTHHACSQSNRTFVPAIVMGAQSRAGGGGQEGYNLSITKYRPKIEFFLMDLRMCNTIVDSTCFRRIQEERRLGDILL